MLRGPMSGLRRTAVGILVLLPLLVAGCDVPPDRAAATDGGADGASSTTGRTCAPAVVEHRFGSTTVDFQPERIVPVSIRDQEALIALDVIPEAVVEGPYRLPYVEWPWVPEAVRASRPEVMGDQTINYEQVGRLRPDLVVGVASGLTDEDYRILRRLAPTVGQSAEFVDYGVPWQELTRTVGELVCAGERAGELVEELEERLADVRRRHARFSGKEVVVAMAGGPEGSYWVYGPQDSRVRFLRALGLELPPEVAGLVGSRFVSTLSRERVDLLDVDVLVWLASGTERAALEADPLYAELDVVREGRVLYLEPDGPEVAAVTNVSPLNLPFVLDTLVPRLAALTGGAGAGATGR